MNFLPINYFARLLYQVSFYLQEKSVVVQFVLEMQRRENFLNAEIDVYDFCLNYVSQTFVI